MKNQKEFPKPWMVTTKNTIVAVRSTSRCLMQNTPVKNVPGIEEVPRVRDELEVCAQSTKILRKLCDSFEEWHSTSIYVCMYL